MRHDKQNILVTRPLSGQEIEYARVLGLNPIIKPALEFEFPEYWNDVLRVINENPRAEWVFTSSNGVKALEQLINAGLQVRPETQLFAVGSKTQGALRELGLDAKIPITQDAEHLARLIADEGKTDAVLYFHGNLSRPELVNGLGKAGIEVTELEVYKTIINEVYLPEEPISAILFYSPSAVEGFAKGQGFEDAGNLPALFAIGSTTGEALEKASGQLVKIADEPSTETLLRNVSNYLFSKEKVK
ncbi:uroporphyrinogen-III synthase [Halalkalibaculum sp. DA3122]|uniref:uroporphyrinogen-III synthase n=1 Tax=unclassified Halalkalibaculum TaxID=2964617 RepID=UPI003753E948